MEQQEIKMIRFAAFEGFLGCHSNISGKVLRRTQRGIRESRVTFGTLTFSGVKVVANGPHKAVRVPRQTHQRAAHHLVRGAVSVDIGGHERANAGFVSVLNDADEALFREWFAKMHEAPA